MLDKLFGAMSPLVTKRASVFTPLIALNFIVGVLSFLTYVSSKNMAVFIPAIILLVYSMYRHEKWANKEPGLLAPQKVALKWLDITQGDNTTIGKEIIETEPVENPDMKQIKAKKSTKGSK